MNFLKNKKKQKRGKKPIKTIRWGYVTNSGEKMGAGKKNNSIASTVYCWVLVVRGEEQLIVTCSSSSKSNSSALSRTTRGLPRGTTSGSLNDSFFRGTCGCGPLGDDDGDNDDDTFAVFLITIDAY
jgi:hypothetical protein